jgi:hypothetical protein
MVSELVLSKVVPPSFLEVVTGALMLVETDLVWKELSSVLAVSREDVDKSRDL